MDGRPWADRNGRTDRGRLLPVARSKRRLRADHEPPEKAPGQPGMIGEDDPLSLGNHGRYIAACARRHNERAISYSALAAAASGAACASEMRAFLPRRPRR